MSITVNTAEAAVRYAEAAKWHIDERQMLHVMQGNGTHVAAYPSGQWASVEREASGGDADNGETAER